VVGVILTLTLFVVLILEPIEIVVGGGGGGGTSVVAETAKDWRELLPARS
jgi:hypothetical protein